jgi:uncharacterized protein with GYD domain
MATYVVLVDFTDQGMLGLSSNWPKIAAEFVETAEASGASVEHLYWTVGLHDGVVLLDAPDDETVTSLLVKLGSLGKIRTHTLRAFDRAQIESILAKAP